MPTVAILLLCAVVLLAYANGANDNFKGVATLYGSGILGYQAAVLLAAVATLLGSLAALSYGSALIAAFSGKGLVPDVVATDPRFVTAVGIAAAVTVLLATRLGFPVSTTHALVGALVGVGFTEAGSAISVGRLGSMFVAPLIASPILAAALTGIQYAVFRSARTALDLKRETCVCVGEEFVPLVGLNSIAAAARVTTVTMDTTQSCIARYQGAVVRIHSGTLLNALHCASAAAASFARGLNDTPKIMALLLAARLLTPAQGFTLIALMIAVGGIFGARRVADTMSHRITAMNAGQAFAGNLTTALLVLSASHLGLPVSTTHVSCGALFGIGSLTGQAQWNTVAQIIIAWITTLPCAILLGVSAALLLR